MCIPWTKNRDTHVALVKQNGSRPDWHWPPPFTIFSSGLACPFLQVSLLARSPSLTPLRTPPPITPTISFTSFSFKNVIEACALPSLSFFLYLCTATYSIFQQLLLALARNATLLLFIGPTFNANLLPFDSIYKSDSSSWPVLSWTLQQPSFVVDGTSVISAHCRCCWWTSCVFFSSVVLLQNSTPLSVA